MNQQERDQQEAELCMLLGQGILQRVRPFGVPCLVLLKIDSSSQAFIQAVALDGRSLQQVSEFVEQRPLYIQ